MSKRNAYFKKLYVILGIIAVLAVLPLIIRSNYVISVCINFCAYAAFATAWNVVGGYAGQLGLAHAAFFSIGAYTSFLMYLRLGISPWIGMLAAIFISALFALLIGAVTFRFKGPYFMLSTIAFGKLVETVLLWQKKLTKGANGLVIPVKGNSLSKLIFVDTTYYFYILLGLLLVSLLIAWQIERSKMGYYLRAIKADENAAESLGIETKNWKILAFLISAVIVTIIGVVYAFYLAYIDPIAIGGMDISTKILAIAVVGGLGNLFGPLLGALLLIPLIELMNAVVKGGAGMMFYGLALILIMTFRPKGLVSFFTGERGVSPLKKFAAHIGNKAHVREER